MKTTRPIMPQESEAFETDRLLVRPIVEEDATDFYKLRTQPEVMIWTTSGKIDEDLPATLKWVQRFTPPNNEKTFSFAVEELSNPGKIVGTIGCHTLEPGPELGYMYLKETWGKGYSTEVLKAFLPRYWALNRREIVVTDDMPEYKVAEKRSDTVRERLLANFEEKNIGSRRVLEKCGFIASGKKEEVEDWRGPAVLTWFYLERPHP